MITSREVEYHCTETKHNTLEVDAVHQSRKEIRWRRTNSSTGRFNAQHWLSNEDWLMLFTRWYASGVVRMTRRPREREKEEVHRGLVEGISHVSFALRFLCTTVHWGIPADRCCPCQSTARTADCSPRCLAARCRRIRNQVDIRSVDIFLSAEGREWSVEWVSSSFLIQPVDCVSVRRHWDSLVTVFRKAMGVATDWSD